MTLYSFKRVKQPLNEITQRTQIIYFTLQFQTQKVSIFSPLSNSG